MSATQVLFEEEIREQYQARAMDYSVMYNDWMREQELDKINQLEINDHSTRPFSDVEIEESMLDPETLNKVKNFK